MTQEDIPVIRIGELLVRSGVITTYDLSEAEKLSAHMKVQFGRLLIMAGCLTEEALECALEAQQLVRDGLLNAEIACEALAFAVQENIPLRQSLEMLDCLPQFGTATLRLAELIHDANIIDDEKLHDAFDTSMESNRPLPEVLVEMNMISPGLLTIMTRIQEQIRNDTLDRDDAINELKGTFKIWTRADKAMANDPMSKSAIISGANAPAPVKPSRFTSSFDSITRLPAISPETLAGLNVDAAAAAKTSAAPPEASPGSFPPQAPAHAMAPPPAQTPVAPFLPPAASIVPPQSLPPQAHPQSSGTNSGAQPPRQSGQNLPDGVILYSQGYFPPDGNASNQSFNDGFSEEDEQRINALLDVFASDSSASPSVTMPLDNAEPVQEPVDNWMFASDGWGVPDLAAAGANLTGAEMFARAQAELNSSGWSYNQAMGTASGQQTPVARDYQQPAATPMAPPPPPPLGQPLYVTPTPPPSPSPPKGLGHPDFRQNHSQAGAPPQSKSSPSDTDSANPFVKLRKTGSMPAAPGDVEAQDSGSKEVVAKATEVNKPERNPEKNQKGHDDPSGKQSDAPAEPVSAKADRSERDEKTEFTEDKAAEPIEGEPECKTAKQDKGDADSEAHDKHKDSESDTSKGEKDKHGETAKKDADSDQSSSAADAKAAHEEELSVKLDAPSKDNHDIVSLLLFSKFFTQGELESAIVKGMKDPTTAVEILHAIGIMDKSSLDAAVRLQKLVKSGSVETNKAISSLEALKAGKIKPAELTEQLGIKKPKRRK
jgi:hypothetical protein